MQKIFVLISLVALLCFGCLVETNAKTAALTLHPSTLCVNHYIETEFEFPEYKGKEEFCVSTSDRLAAFATGWKKWQGSPRLRENDVLCYMPSLLENPFRLVFFNAGNEDSSFLIKGNMVYRDSVLYGASVRTRTEWEEILPIAGELKYLYLDCTVDEEIFKAKAKDFKRLHYLCTSSCLDVIFSFLENCPIEYFHSISSGETKQVHPRERTRERSLSQFLFENNISMGVSSHTKGKLDENRPLKTISSLRYLSIDRNLDYLGWKLEMFSSLEGIIIDSAYKKEYIYYLLSSLPRLRILVENANAIDFSNPPMYIPSKLLVSTELEHLHLTYLALPPGIRFATKKLKSLSVSSKQEDIVASFDLSQLEFLSMKSISDWDKIGRLKKLKILELAEVTDRTGTVESLSLDRLRISSTKVTPKGFSKLLSLATGSEMSFRYFELVKGIDIPKATDRRVPKSVEFLWFSTRNWNTSKALSIVLPMLKDCENQVFLTDGKLSDEVLHILKENNNCRAFMFQGGFSCKDSGVSVDFLPIDTSGHSLANILLQLIEQMEKYGVGYSSWQIDFFMKGFRSIASVTSKRA